MKTKILGCCGRYIQGYGELERLKNHIGWMGDKYLCVASKNRLRDLKDVITNSMEGKEVVFHQFDGECSFAAIDEIRGIVEENGSQAIIGVGGGKVADTVKVVAHQCGLPLVIVPTIAATDAYTSAASLIYRDDGTVEDVQNFPHSPDVVLADTKVLVKGPARFFAAGMGDALSTFVGGSVCVDNNFDNHFGGLGTVTGYHVAKLSYDLLFKYGRQAYLAAQNHVVTDAYNIITEVNILMSGMGFENTGSSLDHLFYFGTLGLPGREEKVVHGEGVAFSVCCMLVLQGASNEQLDEVYRFNRDVGLPITFEDMGLLFLTDEELDMMSNNVLKEVFVAHHPYDITFEMIRSAYIAADKIGKLYHEGGSLL
jgi:glycerol dehydrogenase